MSHKPCFSNLLRECSGHSSFGYVDQNCLYSLETRQLRTTLGSYWFITHFSNCKQTNTRTNKQHKQTKKLGCILFPTEKLDFCGSELEFELTLPVELISTPDLEFGFNSNPTPTLHQTGQMEEDSKRWLILLRCCFVSLFFAFLFESTSNFLFVSDFFAFFHDLFHKIV